MESVKRATLIVIRGLPGSGKSTMAREFSTEGYRHFEADMYLTDETGVYQYDPPKIKEAHEWCQEQTREALGRGERVVISNTFVKRWELAPYLAMTKDHTIITARGEWENVHGVPAEVIERMRASWED